MTTRTLRHLCLAFVVVTVAACDGAGDNDGGFGPPTTPSPTVSRTPDPRGPCGSMAPVCFDDECAGWAQCEQGCKDRGGLDPTGAPYRAICTVAREGHSHDSLGGGLYRHTIVKVSEICYSPDALGDVSFRDTGRCEQRSSSAVVDQFCELIGDIALDCSPDTVAERCRSRHVTLGGAIERSEDCD